MPTVYPAYRAAEPRTSALPSAVPPADPSAPRSPAANTPAPAKQKRKEGYEQRLQQIEKDIQRLASKGAIYVADDYGY